MKRILALAAALTLLLGLLTGCDKENVSLSETLSIKSETVETIATTAMTDATTSETPQEAATETSADISSDITENPHTTEFIEEVYDDIADVSIIQKTKDLAPVLMADFLIAANCDYNNDSADEALAMYRDYEGRCIYVYYMTNDGFTYVDTLDSAVDFRSQVINGQQFLCAVLYDINKAASPAAVYTVINGEPVCVGNGDKDIKNEQEFIYAIDNAGVIGLLKNTDDAGAGDFHGLYWNDQSNALLLD